MSVVGVNATTAAYAAYESTAKTDTKAAEEKKDAASSSGAVYEKSSSDSSKAPYSINKMSSQDRAAIVEQMKKDQQARQNQLADIVNQMLSKQANSYSKAKDDDIWKVLAKGGYSVDAAAKEEAQKLISEDGYYGVKQTSQRIFDFASALAGDDVEQMKKMQAAFEKGYKQATKAWGRELPSISKETYSAVTKLFDDYYDSKKVISE